MDKRKIWMDGKFIRWNDAKVHVMTHAIHYGTGLFEGIRCYPAGDGKGILFRLKDHVKRFFASAEALSMNIPYTEKNLTKAILQTVRMNKEMDCYVRPFAFYGYGRIGPNPRGAKIHVIIFIVPLKGYLGYTPIHVKTSPFRRIQSSALVPGTKISGSYFNAALASMWAHKHGADEALMLDGKGFVAEGAAENIFLVKKGKLITPKSNDILRGITRDTLIKTVRELNLRVIEKRVSLQELLKADEAFFTGTAVEIHPIGRVNNHRVGNGRMGPITEKIRTFYQSLVRGKFRKYRYFLTSVASRR